MNEREYRSISGGGFIHDRRYESTSREGEREEVYLDPGPGNWGHILSVNSYPCFRFAGSPLRDVGRGDP